MDSACSARIVVVVEDPGLLFDPLIMVFDQHSGLGIPDTGTEGHVRLFPNPSADRVMLSTHGPITHVVILDVQGRPVLMGGPMSPGTYLHIGHLPAGAYTVRAFTSTASYHAKLIKVDASD
jgi:hypothetical protein